MRCTGTTKSGVQCKNKVSSGDRCYLHPRDDSPPPQPKPAPQPAPTKKQCAATTKANTCCKKNALDGSDFCHVHNKPTPRENTATKCAVSMHERCTALTNAGERCRNKAVATENGCKLCHRHMGLDYAPIAEDRVMPRCAMFTGKGERCCNRAIEGDHRCRVHAD